MYAGHLIVSIVMLLNLKEVLTGRKCNMDFGEKNSERDVTAERV